MTPSLASLRSSPLAGISAAAFAQTACLAMLFMLAAGNAHPYWWNSVMPSLLLAPAILLLGRSSRSGAPGIQASALPIAVILTSLAIVSLFSGIVNDGDAETAIYWLSAYLSPVVIFMSVQALEVDERFARWCMLAIAAGAVVPLGRGLHAYWQEWGIPTGLELLLSRYSMVRMQGYMDATFGNPGNTAAYLALILPACVSFSMSRSGSWPTRLALIGVTALAAIHVIIVQSRTLFLILLCIVPCIFLFHRVRFTRVVVASVALLAMVLLPVLSVIDVFSTLTVGALSDLSSDESVVDRFSAMQFGLRSLAEAPAFGLGPGHTLTVNPFTSAHQYWIQQGSELGIWGLFLAGALSVLVIARFVTLLLNRASSAAGANESFALTCGSAAYIGYGCVANMPLASSVVNSWIGLFAAMIGLSIGIARHDSCSKGAPGER